VILGGIIGAYVSNCNSRTPNTLQYAIDTSNITSLQLNVMGEVTIQQSQSETNNITITVTQLAASSQELALFTTTFSASNGTVALSATLPSTQDMKNVWQQILHCQTLSILIELPSIIPHLEINVETQNANINLSLDKTAVFKSVYLKTSNGGIDVKSIQSPHIIQVETSNGYITLQNIVANHVDAQTSNGMIEGHDIQFQGNYSALTVKTSNGHINFYKTNVTSGTSASFQSSNGAIDAELIGFKGSFDASTSNGKISVSGKGVSFNVDKNDEKSGNVFSGSNTCSVKSSNAIINLNF